MQANHYTCAYCGAEISSEDAGENEVPPRSDIKRWAELAHLHEDPCDWIELHTEDQ